MRAVILPAWVLKHIVKRGKRKCLLAKDFNNHEQAEKFQKKKKKKKRRMKTKVKKIKVRKICRPRCCKRTYTVKLNTSEIPAITLSEKNCFKVLGQKIPVTTFKTHYSTSIVNDILI